MGHLSALEIRPRRPYLPPRPVILDQKGSPMAANPLQFLQQVRGEVAKIHWPTRREVLLTTLMVFILAALTATFFSLVDVLIRAGMRLIFGA